jgi:hypothetical protein
LRYDMVPIAPFRKILHNRLAEVRKDNENAGWDTLSGELGVSSGRMIWQIATSGRQECITFTLADKIVINYLGVHGWYDDPELSAIYQGVDLHWIDWSSPLTDEIRADQDQLILDLFAEGKNRDAISREIRCSGHRVGRVLATHRAEQKALKEAA